jgi:hypothetical protein
MNRIESQAVLAGVLLKQVREERFPSNAYLDLIEQTIPRQLLDRYVEVLLERVAHERFPSLHMLRRIARVSRSLPS